MNKLIRRQQGIQRARRLLRIYRARNSDPFDPYYANGGRYEHMLRSTRVPCSCFGCGNPRRHAGRLTRQEIVSTD